jgi:hypothetical protein
MTNFTTRLSALGLAALVLVTACGDNIVEPIYGSGCVRDSISAGQSVTGGLSPSSCRQTYNFYTGDVMPYESWGVHLDAGKAYMFHLEQIPDPSQEGLNEVDAVLALYGKNAAGISIPLAVSDDEGNGVDGTDSEFWFVAPRSGDFILVAGSYDWGDFGGYRLTMSTCPVLGALDTAGTYHFASPHSDCVRHSNGPAEVPVTLAFLSVAADSFETISVEIDHDVSTPAYEIFGPGFDTYANIYAESDNDAHFGNAGRVSVSMDEIPGRVTVAVGTLDFDVGGVYSVTLGRTSFAPPAAAPWHDGRLTLRAPGPKKTK